MKIKKQLKKAIGKKATKRLYKKLPWLVPLLAFASSGAAAAGVSSLLAKFANRGQQVDDWDASSSRIS